MARPAYFCRGPLSVRPSPDGFPVVLGQPPGPLPLLVEVAPPLLELLLVEVAPPLPELLLEPLFLVLIDRFAFFGCVLRAEPFSPRRQLTYGTARPASSPRIANGRLLTDPEAPATPDFVAWRTIE